MKNIMTNNKIVSKAEQNRRLNEKVTALMVMVCVACLPEVALAGAAATTTITNVVTEVTNLLTGGIARIVAILFCVGMGFAAWAGKLSWKMAGNFIAGITLIFGAATFVDLIVAGNNSTT